MSSLSLQDQALKELGRTIYNYQKFEAILKALISRSNVYGSGDEVRRNFEKLQGSTSGQTLGALVNRLADTIYGPSKDIPEPDVSKVPHFAFESRTLFASEAARDTHIEKLKEIILARNLLVHQSIAQLKLDSDTACEAFIDDLTLQNKRLAPFLKEFQQKLKGMMVFLQVIEDTPELFIPELAPRPDTIQIGDNTFHKKPSTRQN